MLQQPARERGVHRPQADRRRAGRHRARRRSPARSSPSRAASNFEVVAKGVETHAQREFLAEAGCRICQGELFAVANSAEAVAPMLRARLAA